MDDRYTTPAKGSSDWDVPLNENFNVLDIDVEHRGSGDPDTAGHTPADGAKYLNVDTGEIYLADGSRWTLKWNLGDIGSGGGGGGDVQNADIAPVSVVQYDTQAPIEGATIESFEAGNLSLLRQYGAVQYRRL